MGNSAADDHAADKHGSIAITFAGKEQLSAGAATCQGKGQSGEHHASKVPQLVGMGYRLLFKAGIELAQRQVGNEGSHDERQDTVEEAGIAQHDDIA